MVSGTTRMTPGGGRRPPLRLGEARRRGFTLVELMVILLLIGLLMAILAPSLALYRRRVIAQLSHVAFNQLESAIELYRQDFLDYPPSRDGAYQNPDGVSPAAAWRGSQMLCLLLTGYGPDPGTPGEPQGLLHQDDGQEGYGFRLERRGKVYGPYGDTDTARMRAQYRHPGGTEQRTPRFFVDVYDNPILYYKFDKAAGQYNEDNGRVFGGDPQSAGTDFPTPGPADGSNNGAINTYASDAPVGGQYYRKDYLLLSMGADKRWTPMPDGSVAAGDDLHNMFRK